MQGLTLSQLQAGGATPIASPTTPNPGPASNPQTQPPTTPPGVSQPGLTLQQLQAGGATPIGQSSASTSAPQPGVFHKIGAVAKTVGKALTSSENAFGNDIAGAIIPSTGQVKIAQSASDTAASNIQKLNQDLQAKQAAGQDTTHLVAAIKALGGTPSFNVSQVDPTLAKSNAQIIGDAAGTALDIASAGSYGKAADGAKSFELLSGADKAAAAAKAAEETAKTGSIVKGIETTGKVAGTTAPVTETIAKKGLGQTLKVIGAKTAEHAAVGAGTGYAYDVANNLQQGKTGIHALKPGMGTLLGGTVPVGIGGAQAAFAITADNAPRFINSLIKPNTASFSYGKDPGRTVAAMGITGNNLEDFAKNIGVAKDNVGAQLGAIYSSPANASAKIDGSGTVAKIDTAISNAAEGGKNNQAVVSTLQNIKDSLLFEHGVDKDGNIVKTSEIPKDLSNLSPQQAQDLKSKIASQTKFTGNPSDDKTINSVLKSMYGDLKSKINTAVAPNNPEITDLNQKYADLTSAQLATQNRDAIVQRSNMISAPVKVGGVAGAVASFATHGVSIPSVLAGITAGVLDKALGTTAVKTRIAAWLGSESPNVVAKVFEQNPGIKTVLYRALPKLASQIGR